MVIIVLSGGIGAQLFQYAAGYSIAKKKRRASNILHIMTMYYYFLYCVIQCII